MRGVDGPGGDAGATAGRGSGCSRGSLRDSGGLSGAASDLARRRPRTSFVGIVADVDRANSDGRRRRCPSSLRRDLRSVPARTVADGARFCPSCGHALTRRGDERRVVTVLFADLVGLHHPVRERATPSRSRTSSTAASSASSPTSTSFGGQVDKIVGDAIVALFGAPVAHEDDAERAVRAALRMQETLGRARGRGRRRRAAMRIGVNTGEVLVGALRAGGDYTAMGDVVNTASRLADRGRSRARSLVGPATRAATRDVIRYDARWARCRPRAGTSRSTWVAPSSRSLPPGHRARRLDGPAGRPRRRARRCSATRSSRRRRRTTGPPRPRSSARPAWARPAWPRRSRPWPRPSTTPSCSRAAASPTARPTCGGRSPRPCARRAASRPTRPRTRPASRCTPTASSRRGARRRRPTSRRRRSTRIAEGLLHLLGYEGALREHRPEPRPRGGHRASVLTFVEASARRHRPVVVVLSDLHWADDAGARADRRPARAAGPPAVRAPGHRPPRTWPSAGAPAPGATTPSCSTSTRSTRRPRGELLDRLVERPGPDEPARPARSTAAAATRSSSRSWWPCCERERRRRRQRRHRRPRPPAARHAPRPRRGPARRPHRRRAGRARRTPSVLGAALAGRRPAQRWRGHAPARTTSTARSTGAGRQGDPRRRGELDVVRVPLRPGARGRLRHPHQGRPGRAPRRHRRLPARARGQRTRPTTPTCDRVAHHYGTAAALVGEMGAGRRRPRRPRRAGRSTGWPRRPSGPPGRHPARRPPASSARPSTSLGDEPATASGVQLPARPGLRPCPALRAGRGPRRPRRPPSPSPTTCGDAGRARPRRSWCEASSRGARRRLRRRGRPPTTRPSQPSARRLGDETRPSRGAAPPGHGRAASWARPPRPAPSIAEAARGRPSRRRPPAARPGRCRTWRGSPTSSGRRRRGRAPPAGVHRALHRARRPRRPGLGARPAGLGPLPPGPAAPRPRRWPSRSCPRPTERGDRWGQGMMLLLRGLRSALVRPGRTAPAEPAEEAARAVRRRSATGTGRLQAVVGRGRALVSPAARSTRACAARSTRPGHRRCPSSDHRGSAAVVAMAPTRRLAVGDVPIGAERILVPLARRRARSAGTIGDREVRGRPEASWRLQREQVRTRPLELLGAAAVDGRDDQADLRPRAVLALAAGGRRPRRRGHRPGRRRWRSRPRRPPTSTGPTPCSPLGPRPPPRAGAATQACDAWRSTGPSLRSTRPTTVLTQAVVRLGAGRRRCAASGPEAGGVRPRPTPRPGWLARHRRRRLATLFALIAAGCARSRGDADAARPAPEGRARRALVAESGSSAPSGRRQLLGCLVMRR